MIKKLLLATFGGAMFATPALANTPQYLDGYREGMNVGVFIAYCQSYMEGDFKDPGLARFMANSSYEDMDAENRQWARENYSSCTR